MEHGVINALAHFVTAVGASWSRSQEQQALIQLLKAQLDAANF